VPNSIKENDCENVNTRVQGGEHLLALAHLRAGFRCFQGNEMTIFLYAEGWKKW
jgi:hypothetical protein